MLNYFVETYDPTIENSYRKEVAIDGKSCVIEILDTAGQEEYTALRDQWIRDGEAFLILYSITDRVSFNRVQRYHSQIQRIKGTIYAGSHWNVPVIVVGNNSDRVTEREVSVQEGHEMAEKLDCSF